MECAMKFKNETPLIDIGVRNRVLAYELPKNTILNSPGIAVFHSHKCFPHGARSIRQIVGPPILNMIKVRRVLFLFPCEVYDSFCLGVLNTQKQSNALPSGVRCITSVDCTNHSVIIVISVITTCFSSMWLVQDT